MIGPRILRLLDMYAATWQKKCLVTCLVVSYHDAKEGACLYYDYLFPLHEDALEFSRFFLAFDFQTLSSLQFFESSLRVP